MKRSVLFAIVFFISLAILFWAVDHYQILSVPPTMLLATRWLAIGALLNYAFRRRTLTVWIMVSMIMGVEIGNDWPEIAINMHVLSEIFLRMIKVIVAPLLFATLVSGIAQHADLKKIGRMGIKAFVYFELATTAALFIGLAAINISHAGVGVKLPPHLPDSQIEQQLPIHKATSASEMVVQIFPENIAKSVADNQVLQVVVFCIIFGVSLALVREDKRQPMLAFAESLAEVMFRFTNIVMLLAPFGVAGAIAYTVATTGLDILFDLARLVATLYTALIVFILTILLPIALVIRAPIRKIVRAIIEPVTIAFSTSSSEAALPRVMESMEAVGVSRQTVAFVIPAGYSFNLTGSTLHLAVATLFTAQAAGIHLSWQQQLIILLTLMLTSKGVASVPRASLVILLGTASQFGLPIEPIFLILGVDHLMDMARSAANVIGNCLAAVVVARWEGESLDGKTPYVPKIEKTMGGGATSPKTYTVK